MVWPFIILTYLGIFCLGFLDNIRGPLFSEILNIFSLTDGQGAWFFTITSLCSIGGAITSFFIVHKTDRIQGMRLSLFLLFLGGVVISVSRSFNVLLGGAALLGVGFGLMGALQSVLVTIGSTSHRRQQFVTGLHAMYGFASLLAPIMVATLMKFYNQWRIVFAVAACFPLIVIGYTFFIDQALFHRAKKYHEDVVLQTKLWTVDKFLLVAILGLYTMVELFISTRLSLYLQRRYFFDLEKSSLYLSYFYFVFLFSRVVFSVRKFHIPLNNQISILLLLSALTMVLGISLDPLFLIMSGLFMAPCFPLCITYISEKYKHDLDSMMMLVFAMQSVFVVTMHISVGYLSDIIGLVRVIWMGPLLLALSFWLLRIYEKQKQINHNNASPI